MPSFPRPICKLGFLSVPIHLFVRLLKRFGFVRGGQMHGTARPGDRSPVVLLALQVACSLCALLTLNVAMICAKAQTLSFEPTWVQLSPATSPSARWGATMAYDSVQGKLVLFGGNTDSGDLADTWTWNGTTWTQVDTSQTDGPPGRNSAVMAYDSAHGQVVLFGGAGASGLLGDTWIWNGTTWTQQILATSPVARQNASMAYDAAAGQVVLFGGEALSGILDDTWTWDGTTWTQQSPASSPQAMYSATAAYDSAEGQVVLLEGSDGNGYPDQTWTWNGTTWTQPYPANSPPPRLDAMMAYDPAQSQVVLFGGYYPSFLSDTWTWNGTDWARLYPLTSPSARSEAAMAFDAAHGQVVLFGGGGESTSFLGDTWVLDLGAVSLGTANVCLAVKSTPAPCSQSATLNFSVSSPTGANVGSIVYLTEGVPNLDFKQSSTAGTCKATSYPGPANCTVKMTFAPTVAGQRNGAVVFYSGEKGTGSVIGSVLVHGTGVGPLVVLNAPVAPTVLGAGFDIPRGVALDASGDVYVADEGLRQVYEITPGCTSSSCVYGVASGFGGPTGVALDGMGNVYVADYINSAVYEIQPGCTSETCAMLLGGGFGGPTDVAVDGSGNVYVADFINSVVDEMPPNCASSSCVTALGGGFDRPAGVAVDGSGNVYVADAYNNAVKEIPAGCAAFACVATLGGGFSLPYGVTVDGAGTVYVADGGNSAVKEMPAGCVSPSCVTALGSGFINPDGVALDRSGNAYVADIGNKAVEELQRATPPALTFDNTPIGSMSADSPKTVTVQNIGNASLKFSVISYATDFPEEASAPATACSTSAALAAGMFCTLPIDFSPHTTTEPGKLSESVKLTDDALNAISAVQSVSVNGTATSSADTPATLTTPVPGSTLVSPDVSFDWTASSRATKYLLHLGSTGKGSDNLYSSGQISGTTVTAKNLPTNGEKIYARLYTYFGTASVYTDYTYTAEKR
jgi:sugar lactone lactonase YvrE